MGCSHCMVDANPDGGHMSREVFEQTLTQIRQNPACPIIMISGGEPTEHPELLDFVRLAQPLSVLLLTNGEFLWTKPELRNELLPLVHSVQVTTDRRYYPREIKKYKHEKVHWIDGITHLSPHGRGRDCPNEGMIMKRAPECFNMRSMARSGYNFHLARMTLVGRGKFCTPSVNIDGSISAGESPFCTKIGVVTDDPDQLMDNLSKMTCQKCGMVDNLAAHEKQAIGEQ